jgi:hypothetical protein
VAGTNPSGEGALRAALDQLPSVERVHEGAEALVIDGFLLRGGDTSFRLVAGHLCLEFDHADVVETAEHEALDIGDLTVAPLVRVSLRRGARLLSVTSSYAFRDLIWRPRRPFALATREAQALIPPSPGFQKLEADYRRQHGLEDAEA